MKPQRTGDPTDMAPDSFETPAVAPGPPDSVHANASRLEALVTLLGDESATIHEIARDELIRSGQAAIPHLKRAARLDHAATRGRARALLVDHERARARRRMIQYVGQGGIELEPALFLMSRLERPDFDALPYKKALDAFAKGVQRRLREDPNTPPAMALAEYLGGQLGFCGKAQDYHHPDRIYLHRVIETKTGLPLSLSALYILVGRRLGIRAAVLPFPGHVLLRVYGKEGPILIDPFHGGEVRTHEECLETLKRQGLEARARWFHDAPDALLIQRQLMNLMRSLRSRGLRRDARETLKLAALVERGRKKPK